MALVGTKAHTLTAYSNDLLAEEDEAHICPTKPTAQAAEEWLDRQRLLGLISPEGAAAVERLIGDLG
jgi:hypothetical protein